MDASSGLYHQPSYIVNASGIPEAVIIDMPTWQRILEQLEDVADKKILNQARADLRVLATGQQPTGWQPWADFEAEVA